MSTDTEANRIRELNDALRCFGTGGQIFITRGVQALGEAATSNIVNAVRVFDDFSSDNDPHGEHDCATLVVDDRRIIWKIDYYDVNREFGSPDPADTSVTKRVMTIMLADEY